MKKITTTLAAGLLFLAPSLALAASIAVTPATVHTTVGQTFTVALAADPSGSPLYTVSANLTFDPSILEVTGFTLAPTWIAVTQSGYDLTDNTKGSLIKTGGYPGGFAVPTAFGTITLRAIAAGNATVTVTGDSIMLDGGSNNELSGSQGTVTVTVGNAAPTPTQTQNTTAVSTPNNSVGPGNTGTTGVSTTSANNANQAAAAALTASGTSQTAAAANAFGNVPAWLWWLILAIVVIGGGYWLWRQYGTK